MLTSVNAVLLVVFVLKCRTQDNITFSPDRAPCVGDTIEMICSIVPPPSETFGGTVATVSINGSVPFTQAQINSNSVFVGIDLSRYSANVDGLNPSFTMSVIRLIINSYLPLDSDTIFLCATTLSNGDPYNSTMSGSTMKQAGPLVLTPSTLTVKSNISRDSGIFVSIQHDLSTVDRPDTLNYSFTLYSNGAAVDYLSQLTPVQAISTPFSTKFELDNYYHISVTIDYCAGVSGSVDSKIFVLIELQSDNGKFQTSSSNASRIEWVYTNLETPAGGFEQDYLSEDYFTFTIDNEIITEFSLYLPQRFDFALPPGYDNSSGQGLLAISFNGELFLNITVVVEQTADNTLTILLILFLVIMVTLLCVVVVITVVFVVIYYKRYRIPRNNHFIKL